MATQSVMSLRARLTDEQARLTTMRLPSNGRTDENRAMFEAYGECLDSIAICEERIAFMQRKAKLESEHLCRRCKKVAKDAWEDSIDAVYRVVNTFRSDAEAILLEYVDKEIAYE